MPAIPSSMGASGPSTLDKAKMGAMMGGSKATIHMAFAEDIAGATNIIRFGPGPNGMLRTLGQYMLGSAATFGFFMSIGTTIRTESSPTMTAAFARAGRPFIIPREQLRLRRDNFKLRE